MKQQPLETTHAADRVLRAGLSSALPHLTKADVKMSIRRTFQALRIAVNDEFSALEALLRSLPLCLAPGGRVAMLTFHSGEDRRVKKAFQARFPSGDLLGRGGSGYSFHERRDIRESARLSGEAALGRARDSY